MMIRGAVEQCSTPPCQRNKCNLDNGVPATQAVFREASEFCPSAQRPPERFLGLAATNQVFFLDHSALPVLSACPANPGSR